MKNAKLNRTQEIVSLMQDIYTHHVSLTASLKSIEAREDLPIPIARPDVLFGKPNWTSPEQQDAYLKLCSQVDEREKEINSLRLELSRIEKKSKELSREMLELEEL